MNLHTPNDTEHAYVHTQYSSHVKVGTIFSGLPTVQFLIAFSMQKQRGKYTLSIHNVLYHVNEISVYLGRQKGGGVPIESFWPKS